MQFQAVVKDLSSSKLNEIEVSKKIIDGFLYILDICDDLDKLNLIRMINKAKSILLKTVSDNALVKNILGYLLYDIELVDDVRSEFKKRCNGVDEHFNLLYKNIINEGSKKIKNNCKIFVLGNNDLIMRILRKAKKDGKNFEVNNTELRPKHLGKFMANNLSKIGIYVNHYPDSAIRYALKGCDLALIEGIGMYDDRLISNLGINTVIDFCEKENISVYVCFNSWNFGKKKYNIQKNKLKNMNLLNPEFEEADLSNVLVISELGIFKGKGYLSELKSRYPWISSSF